MEKIFSKTEWLAIGKSFRESRDGLDELCSRMFASDLRQSEKRKLSILHKKFNDVRCELDNICARDMEGDFESGIFYGHLMENQ